MPDGWRCPECGLILAPSVTEHRCNPPSAGVLAVAPAPDGPPDITVKTSASLSAEQIKQLTQAVQRQLLKQVQRNRRLA
jgi:hypothetical protein